VESSLAVDRVEGGLFLAVRRLSLASPGGDPPLSIEWVKGVRPAAKADIMPVR
jgi:hypothetical protein